MKNSLIFVCLYLFNITKKLLTKFNKTCYKSFCVENLNSAEVSNPLRNF